MLKCTRICLAHLKAQSALLPARSNVLKQQSRNTFILKRVHPPPLYKKYEHKPKLTHKHFIYELVEDTNVKKQKRIDVLMLKTVKNVGEAGDIASVPYQRAYETLLLPKLATYPTPENLQHSAYTKKEITNKLPQFSSKYVERTINLLSQCCLSINVSTDVPWTLEKWHIRVSFRRAGYIVPESAITLPQKTISGPDMSIENKEFYITVKINNCEEVKVRCRVLHYNPDPTKQIKYNPPHFMCESVAIFPEDQAVLNSLPKHRLLTTETNDVDE